MFNGIWLVAVEPLTIQGREVKAGERFHISRVHSGALLVTGRATIAHPQPGPKSKTAAPPEPPPPVVRRRGRPRKTETPDAPAPPVAPEIPVVPETPGAPAETPEVIEPADDDVIDTPRRQYHRRDLEAEP